MEPVNQHPLFAFTDVEPKSQMLVEKLRTSEYIQNEGLSSLSLEDLGNHLFEAKSTQSSGELEQLINDYCLLIQELEAQGQGDSTGQSLEDLRQRETRTHLLHAVATTPTIAENSAEEIPLELNDIPIVGHDPLITWDKIQEEELAQETPPAETVEPETPAQMMTEDAEMIEMENTLTSWRNPFPSESPPPETAPQSRLSPIAEDFWKTGLAFIQGNIETVTEFHRQKIAAISFCWSLEKELVEKFWPAISTHWSDRALSTVPTLDVQSKKFDLPPDLRGFLDRLAEENSGYLQDSKIPYSGIINSLRYLLATEEIEKLRPSLLDWGVILFWFTKDTERAGIQFSNLLNFIEVHDEHLVELVFRMFRLNKLRLKALSVQQNFDFDDFETLRADIERSLELLKLFKPKAE